MYMCVKIGLWNCKDNAVFFLYFVIHIYAIINYIQKENEKYR